MTTAATTAISLILLLLLLLLLLLQLLNRPPSRFECTLAIGLSLLTDSPLGLHSKFPTSHQTIVSYVFKIFLSGVSHCWDQTWRSSCQSLILTVPAWFELSVNLRLCVCVCVCSSWSQLSSESSDPLEMNGLPLFVRLDSGGCVCVSVLQGC